MSLASNNPFRQAAKSQNLSASPASDSEDKEIESTSLEEAAREIAKEEPLLDPANFQTYIVYNTSSHINLRIAQAGSAKTLYYVAHSNFTPRTPDLILYAGEDTEAPVVGIVKMSLVHKAEKVGLGNPSVEAGPDKIVWEELTRISKWTHKTYSFEWGEKPERQKYEWRRIKTVAWDATPDMVLVKAGTRELEKGESGPEVLAQYLHKPLVQWKKRGTFDIRKGGDEKWEKIVLLTGLTLLEASRRRSRQRR